MLQLDAAQNLARVLSRDADVAEDIVQEAFLQAYRGFQGYEGGDPRAWIFAIVRNCHRQWLRQQRRKMRLEVENTSSSSPDEDRAKNVASDADTPEMTLCCSGAPLGPPESTPPIRPFGSKRNPPCWLALPFFVVCQPICKITGRSFSGDRWRNTRCCDSVVQAKRSAMMPTPPELLRLHPCPSKSVNPKL